MKFVDAIMGNSTADDHCMEFITQGGLEPLFQILRLPNLPVDFPTSPACQSVSSVCTILLVRNACLYVRNDELCDMFLWVYMRPVSREKAANADSAN